MTKPRVVIADDHTLMTDGLRRLLESDFDIVATASTGRQLISILNVTPADAVVLDIGMPELNGIEAARDITKNHPRIKIVFVTQQTDRHYIQAAFRAGAIAFVSKQSASSELQVAIRKALKGESYITPLLGFDGESILSNSDSNAKDIFGGDLTARQREVLQLTAEGKTVKEIAIALRISPKTVEFHKAAVMDQLGLRTTADLTRYALVHGIVSAPSL
jgi:DNA-binding NarL/FixJ family response regulator